MERPDRGLGGAGMNAISRRRFALTATAGLAGLGFAGGAASAAITGIAARRAAPATTG